MGRAVKKGLLLDYPRMHAEAEEALKTLGHPEINVHLECGKLGVGQQQMVEIGQGCVPGCQVSLLLDEPLRSFGIRKRSSSVTWSKPVRGPRRSKAVAIPGSMSH